MVPVSVLDLAPVPLGSDVAQSLRHSLTLAQHAERWGYRRYWVAEHHNMPGIASAATSVVIGFLAAGTTSLRLGSGGIMLPNHAPLVIAEQFGTLEALYPGRIDLGLGRAPGTDQRTMRALRRDRHDTVDTFPQDVLELQAYFAGEGDPRIKAVPGDGAKIPIWLLGSSLYSAQLAAALGLPFAFAAHFAPDLLATALDLYRREFQPSATLPESYAMAAIPVYAADSDEEARHLFTSLQQAFLNLHRGVPGKLPAPADEMDALWSSAEAAGVRQAFKEAVVGSPTTVRRGINAFVERTRVDELMISAMIHAPAARLRSFEIVAEAMGLERLRSEDDMGM